MSTSTFSSEEAVNALIYTDDEARDAVGNTIGNGLQYNPGTRSISIKPKQSLTTDALGVGLSGDVDTPGPNMVYGTNSSGVRIWKTNPTGSKYRRDLKHAPTIYFEPFDAGGTNWYGGATATHDTTIKSRGLGSVRLSCPTGGGLVGMRKRIHDVTGVTPSTLNLGSGSYGVEFSVRCSNWMDIVTLELLVGNVLMSPNYWKLDFINTVSQTGKVSESTLENNVWMTFTFSQEDFSLEDGVFDWANTQDIIIRASSTVGTTPTVWIDSIRFIQQASEGAVLFCADDSWSDQMNLLDIADKYGQKVCLFVIPDSLGAGGYLTQGQVDAAHDGGHIIAMHGATSLISMTGAALDAAIEVIVAYRDAHEYYLGSHMFALPEGKMNTEVYTKLKPHFKYIFSIDEQKAYPFDNECIRIPRRSLLNTTSTATATGLMNSAMNQKGLQIINFHHVITTPAIITDYSIANTEILFQYATNRVNGVVVPSWLKLFP